MTDEIRARRTIELSITQTDAIANAVINMADGDADRAVSIIKTIEDCVDAKLADGYMPAFARDICKAAPLVVRFELAS